MTRTLLKMTGRLLILGCLAPLSLLAQPNVEEQARRLDSELTAAN